MAGLWYRAGTIAVTGGSKKVVGTGTTWKSGVSKPDKGHLVWGPDGKPYELDYVESDTVLYLVTAYSGVTATGMAYSIDITRTGTIPAFSRELSAQLAYAQGQYDSWQQVLTGAGMVPLTAPDGQKIEVPALSAFQPTSDSLKALHAVVPAANKLPVFNSSTEAKLIDLPAFAQSLLSKAATPALARAELDAKQEDTNVHLNGSLNWFKLASVNIPQNGFTEVIELFGNAGYDAFYNKGANKVEIIIRSFNGNPKSISVTARMQSSVNRIFNGICFTNPSADTYDIYVKPSNIYVSNIRARGSRNVSFAVSNSGSETQPAGSTAGLIHTQFDTNNIIGTVSMLDGIPVGGIVEYGENANGMYIKFAGGLMICFCKIDVNGIAITSATGSVFQSSVSIRVNYPATFIGVVRSFSEVLYLGGGTRPWNLIVTQGSTYSDYVLQAGASMSNFSGTILVGVVGRWYYP
ncbi:hypothetical protein [Aeromonas simiae]|uniref:hypothetical protein n=1 Tax=Aeromonas simiae TaxID=218936 RepID=UPI00266D6C09|nr:hypothetical protein [Aeromonas simiae]MDO2950547.1 hypothetical protein [Aeromonas simiae]